MCRIVFLQVVGLFLETLHSFIHESTFMKNKYFKRCAACHQPYRCQEPVQQAALFHIQWLPFRPGGDWQSFFSHSLVAFVCFCFKIFIEVLSQLRWYHVLPSLQSMTSQLVAICFAQFVHDNNSCLKCQHQCFSVNSTNSRRCPPFGVGHGPNHRQLLQLGSWCFPAVSRLVDVWFIWVWGPYMF